MGVFIVKHRKGTFIIPKDNEVVLDEYEAKVYDQVMYFKNDVKN